MPKNYTYIRKYITYNGVQYEVRGKTEAEAIAKLAIKKLQLERGEIATGGYMPVDDWFKRWKKTYKDKAGLTEKSLAAYDGIYNNYIKPAIGKKRLKDVDDTDLQDILNDSAGKSFSQLSKLRSTMQQLFSQARRSRLILYNPAEDLILPKNSRGTRRSLTDEERKLFLAAEPTVPGGDILFAMLYTGMRPGELMTLDWGDIDFDKQEISVTKAIESGTDSKIKSTKTAAGNRVIPLRPALAERLRSKKGPSGAPVFVNRAGNRQNRKSFERAWSSILRAMDIAAGAELYRNQIKTSALAPDLVPYCLRHTFCTDLQKSGVPINIAKEIMGHTDIATTANIYTHRDTASLHSYMRAVDKPQKVHVARRPVRGNKTGK